MRYSRIAKTMPRATVVLATVLALCALPTASWASSSDPSGEPSACSAPGRLTLAEIASSRVVVCDGTSASVEIAAGRVFDVPDIGVAVVFSAVVAEGSPSVSDVIVAHGADGRVAVEVGPGDHDGKHTYGPNEVLASFETSQNASTSQVSALTSSSKCDLNTYSINTYRWPGTYQWRFRATAFGGQAAMSAGIQAMANGTGGCGVNVQNGATASYLGTTSTQSTVGSNNICLVTDSVNVVDSGPLPSGTLAGSCVYKTPSDILYADVKFNTIYSWYTGTSLTLCTGAKYDVQGIMTHEAGHVFGLNHVAQTSGQVMKPTSSTCETSQRALGTGDLAGMKALYG